jgi:Xaa-Pro aminopeptidase
MTRVVFFGAEPSEEMRKIYYVVKEAQEAALKMCKPGETVGKLDQAARDHITAAGYGDKFTHSLGHGIGLEVHESPTLRNKTPRKDTVLERRRTRNKQ